jgi:hypothetical protein
MPQLTLYRHRKIICENIIKRPKYPTPAHDPEHIKTAKSIDRHQPLLLLFNFRNRCHAKLLPAQAIIKITPA